MRCSRFTNTDLVCGTARWVTACVEALVYPVMTHGNYHSTYQKNCNFEKVLYIRSLRDSRALDRSSVRTHVLENRLSPMNRQAILGMPWKILAVFLHRAEGSASFMKQFGELIFFGSKPLIGLPTLICAALILVARSTIFFG